jgi:hypothetical protein
MTTVPNVVVNNVNVTVSSDTWLEIARCNYIELANVWHQWGLSPVDVRNRQEMTPLQFAVRLGHVPMVEWFLQIYPHPKLLLQNMDQRGQTALDAVRVVNHHDAVVWLLEPYCAPVTNE